MTSDLQYADILNSKGIRPSVQRLAVYKFVNENKIHPTVDTVYTALSPNFPTLSRTTVYNTLHLFSEKKLVQALPIEDDELRYDANMTPHIHFKCTKCGKIIDVFDSDLLPKFNNDCNGLIPKGSVINRIQTSIWGLCPDCSKGEN